MEANELRIGNVIQCALNESLRLPDGVPHVVSAILPFGEIVVDLSPTPQTTVKCEIKHCSGIPLTPEWLERAGFVKEFDDVYSIGLPTGDGVDLLLEWGDCSLRRNHVGKEKKKGDKNPYDYAYIKAPKYLHKLQNLYYALTGTELEFK